MISSLNHFLRNTRAKVHYLGVASGTTVSHVSDIVGPDGVVYAVEFSHRSGRDLVNMAKKRTNILPINEDARHPSKYRMFIHYVENSLQARSIRKTLGGGMRQVGILCAAAIIALKQNVSKLQGDHEKAKRLAGSLCAYIMCDNLLLFYFIFLYLSFSLLV
ncbi:hypothetical protein Dimus_022578 [Dionaea muscipula]